MGKYKIINESIDNYILKYKDKELPFKTDIELMTKIQGARKDARLKMILDLSKRGTSLQELTIITKKDGKTYEDNTNREAMENAYIEDAMNDLLDEICKEKFNMSLAQLLVDMDVLKDTEIVEFVTDLTSALTGKTPSERK
mgnify:CR=1 FL=1